MTPIECEFYQHEGQIYICRRCGHVMHNIRVLPIHRICHKPNKLEKWLTTVLLGDAIATVAEKFGIDRLATWLADKAGTECGCKERQARLNYWHRRQAKKLTHSLERFLNRVRG